MKNKRKVLISEHKRCIFCTEHPPIRIKDGIKYYRCGYAEPINYPENNLTPEEINKLYPSTDEDYIRSIVFDLKERKCIGFEDKECNTIFKPTNNKHKRCTKCAIIADRERAIRSNRNHNEKMRRLRDACEW
jgi:hypothetical protein